MTNSPTEITAVVCTYLREDLLEIAINGLNEQTLSKNRYKILIVDNSPKSQSSESTATKYESMIPNLTYLYEQRPGLSRARNIAASMCESPYIAYIDDDAIPDPLWLEQIVEVFEVYGPATMVVGGPVHPIWGAAPPLWLHTSLMGALSIVDWGDDTRPAGPQEWFAGTNIAFRRDAILQNGGFATDLGRIGSGTSLLSNEEIDLLRRIRAAGGQFIYAADAKVRHRVDSRRLTRSWFRKRSAWQAVSDFIMNQERLSGDVNKRWSSAVNYFNLLPLHLRTIKGLVLDTDDPELFRRQISAIYQLTSTMLAGFEGIDLD